MKNVVASGTAVAVLMLAAGCVTEQQHQQVVEEMQAVKADLEKMRSQKSAAEQQAQALKEANDKMVTEIELASAELLRLRESREKERGGVDQKIRDQENKIKELMGQQRALKHDYEEAKQKNETLKAAVARYQKELKERPAPAAMPAPTPVAKAPAPAPSPTPAAVALSPATKVPTAPTPAAAPSPAAKIPVAPAPAAPAASTASKPAALSPINLNTASASDMVLFLGLTKDVADKVVSNRPYRLRGELVAKKVVPQTTFEMIRDRITVAQ
jgi:DNA uptake protein ComE-like DNA-binding protein